MVGLKLIFIGLITYFLEALNIMQSNERILSRKSDVVLLESLTSRWLSHRYIFVVISSPIVVLTGLALGLD